MDEFAVGQLAQSLVNGYTSYVAALLLVRHPAATTIIETMKAENRGPAAVPVGYIAHKGGGHIAYHLTHHLELARNDAVFHEEYARAWVVGALLTLGDRLSDAGYFDKGPDLELLRHLRNGVAHGNMFHFLHGEPRRPAKYKEFEVTAALEGQPVLFDFMEPGDILVLLQRISVRLIRIANGDPPLPDDAL